MQRNIYLYIYTYIYLSKNHIHIANMCEWWQAPPQLAPGDSAYRVLLSPDRFPPLRKVHGGLVRSGWQLNASSPARHEHSDMLYRIDQTDRMEMICFSVKSQPLLLQHQLLYAIFCDSFDLFVKV